ncbi:MAG: hypothetical protein VW378_03500 [bacterium]
MGKLVYGKERTSRLELSGIATEDLKTTLSKLELNLVSLGLVEPVSELSVKVSDVASDLVLQKIRTLLQKWAKKHGPVS